MILNGIKAIADFLNVHPSRVRVLAHAGLPCRVIGHGRGARYLATRAAVLAWISPQPPATFPIDSPPVLGDPGAYDDRRREPIPPKLGPGGNPRAHPGRGSRRHRATPPI